MTIIVRLQVKNVFTTPDEVSVWQEKVLQFLKRKEKSLALLEFLIYNQQGKPNSLSFPFGAAFMGGWGLLYKSSQPNYPE